MQSQTIVVLVAAGLATVDAYLVLGPGIAATLAQARGGSVKPATTDVIDGDAGLS